MGAAAGSWACTANILRMNISYNNFDMLEIGYGINLRPLTSLANKVYADDRCEAFMPKILEENILHNIEIIKSLNELDEGKKILINQELLDNMKQKRLYQEEEINKIFKKS